ncbi:MAG: AI-2E family transporter, partial [Thermoanaerobaculales bacterium]|nr:AI-2E family transporter [Thermoanaerobaculales bacterium]
MQNPENNSHPGARFLLMSASAIIVIGGLKIAGSLIVPFLLAAFLSILCLPAVDWLARHRVPKVIAVLVVVLILGALLSGFGAIVGGSVNQFTAAAPKYEERVDQLWVSAQGWVEQLPFELLPFSSPVGDYGKPLEIIKPGQVMSFLGTSLKGVLAALQNTFLVILTLVFMLVEATTFPSKISLAFGEDSGNIGRFSGVTD